MKKNGIGKVFRRGAFNVINRRYFARFTKALLTGE